MVRTDTETTTTNERNIYEIPNGWYLHLQYAGEVYRKAFSANRYGGMQPALEQARLLRDKLEPHRALIEQAIRDMKARPDDEALILAELRATVTNAETYNTTVIGSLLAQSERAAKERKRAAKK